MATGRFPVFLSGVEPEALTRHTELKKCAEKYPKSIGGSGILLFIGGLFFFCTRVSLRVVVDDFCWYNKNDEFYAAECCLNLYGDAG